MQSRYLASDLAAVGLVAGASIFGIGLHIRHEIIAIIITCTDKHNV